MNHPYFTEPKQDLSANEKNVSFEELCLPD